MPIWQVSKFILKIKKMKRIIFILFVLLAALQLPAQQEKHKFSKEQFKAEIQAFIIKESCMTQEEADKFFPVYNEMKHKQRELFYKQREIFKAKPCDERRYAEAIKKRDELEVEVKKIQQAYNLKLMKLIPPSKLLKAINAEDRFHRKALNRFNNGSKPKRK